MLDAASITGGATSESVVYEIRHSAIALIPSPQISSSKVRDDRCSLLACGDHDDDDDDDGLFRQEAGDGLPLRDV
eukprot:scaffold124066_cov35-Attheya_sp.AAC.1